MRQERNFDALPVSLLKSASLTPELARHCNGDPAWRARAFPVSRFRSLVEHVAGLAYANRDELLFFRGQDKDYQSKSGGTTLYPQIYRDDVLPHRTELREELAPGDLGEFIKEWPTLEDYLVANGRQLTQRNLSVREAISALAKKGLLSSEDARLLESLRSFRNTVVHKPQAVHAGSLQKWLFTVRNLAERYSKNKP